jgi:hypothetical protein
MYKAWRLSEQAWSLGGRGFRDFTTSGKKRAPSETAFFSNFLTAVRHKATTGRDAEQMRQRLIHRMCELADSKNASQILLLADEGQNFSNCEYEWLRDVHDDLQQWGKSLLVVLVGLPEPHGQEATFQRSNSMHIVSRLIVHELAFRGARRPGLCHLFAGLRPAGVPGRLRLDPHALLLSHGLRRRLQAASEGSALWYAFDQAHRSTLWPEALEIGMEFFTAAVEHLMLTHSHHRPELDTP